ncbi:hypothetical protein C4D60_Mb01t23250 [Musa balbisiana]|uniref:Uncharacterized protein n=1 Tax=Musa balbisiana TaxID=52838 RepID=A0A4S8JPI3_MUSBA|nr:hypothetical protein C4D60_Mb01t23250 [Musa balbisiana]
MIMIPICASIWSCPSEGVLHFSAYSVLSFCRNHHLLQNLGFYWSPISCNSESSSYSEAQINYLFVILKGSIVSTFLLEQLSQLPSYGFHEDGLKIASEADLGLADAYINGYFSFVDKEEGLLDLFMVLIANRDLRNSTGKNIRYTGITLSDEQLKYAKRRAKEAGLEMAYLSSSIDHLENIGIHYYQTLRCWRNNFFANKEKILALGFDEKFFRTWEYYFMYRAAGFKSCMLGDYQGNEGHLFLAEGMRKLAKS